MVFSAPTLDTRERAVLEEIGRLRESLRFRVSTPRRWLGSLRRLADETELGETRPRLPQQLHAAGG